MERKIVELEDEATKLKGQISQLDIELDSQQGEKNAKYEELLKRDREMQSFLENFETKKREAHDRNAALEKSIVDLLDRIRQSATKYESAVLPSPDTYKDLQGDLQFKEKELNNSQMTVGGLTIERDKRLRDLEKVNQLETKLNSELGHLKQKIVSIEAEMGKISNTEEVKKTAEETRQVFSRCVINSSSNSNS
ncbi:hypothetical protein BJ742DRAFT_434024 [Cladochytrium replicatum]|nr:hypothetical protein BJ742DRAFT_434024 [Cladochytrium replicatum]